MTTGITYTTTPGAITASASRSTSQLVVGATGATYTITFSNADRMKAGNQIVMTFPNDQIVYNAAMTCSNSLNYACTFVSGTNSFTLTVTQWCSASADCAAGTSLTLTINNA